VDYLKIKLLLKQIQTQKFLMMYTMSCAVNLQVTEVKRGFKEVGEEKRKEKEALRVEREKLKKTQTRRRSSETAASCKSESCYSWTCSSR
jgi:hypothetical protein